MIRICAHPRIHMTLIDLAGCTKRDYGGVGFSIDEPATIIEVRKSGVTELIGFERFDRKARRDVLALLERMKEIGLDGGLHVSLLNAPPQHSGFGSKSSLLLSSPLKKSPHSDSL